MVNPYCDLDYYMVAFVDILGFSEMVRCDCENQNPPSKYFEILQNINEKTKRIGDCNIIHFSDSVIFSLPLDKDNYYNYKKILTILSDYQYELFRNSIICRGAIAYGKHYEKDGFLFSQALIEAYQLESREAKYPRIIISPDLQELCFSQDKDIVGVIQEKDNFCFIDYFQHGNKNELKEILQKYNSNIHKYSIGVQEKYYWLFDYWEFVFDDKLPFNQNRFSRI